MQRMDVQLLLRSGVTDTSIVMANENSKVIPSPQEIYWQGNNWEIGRDNVFACDIELEVNSNSVAILPQEIHKRIQQLFGMTSIKNEEKSV